MIRLGINVDHVATLRQARREKEPDPVQAALQCEEAGAHNITVHLREDLRHIQEADLRDLKKLIKIKLNLEMANDPQIIRIALEVVPDEITMVPEKREEITTEGGLDVVKEEKNITEAVQKLSTKIEQIGLFIDPIYQQIEASKRTGASHIEFHTGTFVNAKGEEERKKCLDDLMKGAVLAQTLGLHVHAGHGINYVNVKELLEIPYLEEVNIGHSIISRAVFVGIHQAVKEMLQHLGD